MALAPEYYEQAINSAQIHVRITQLAVSPVSRGKSRVAGTVEQVFRGAEWVCEGERVEFTINALSDAEERMLPPMPGHSPRMSYDSMVKAQAIEAYLDLVGEPQQFSPVWGVVKIV